MSTNNSLNEKFPEMPNIDEKKEDKPESNFDSYAVVRRGRGNKGFSFNNGERTSGKCQADIVFFTKTTL